MPAFDAKGISLYFEEKGVGEPVVFVHGTLCDWAVWQSLAGALSQKFRTVAYSRRYAHPNTRAGDLTDSTVQNNAEDLDALIDGMGAGKVHLIGHSYGGFISAFFAVRHPEKLRSLTLVNAAVATMLVRKPGAAASLSLLLRSPSVALSANKLLKATDATVKSVQGGDQAAAYRVFLPALLDDRNDLPPKPGDFEQMVTRNARTVRETTTPFPEITAKEMRTVMVPALVVWGELSAPWDYRVSQSLAQSIPGSEREIIPGAGHFCFLERPSDVSARILEFLMKHPSG